MGVRIELSPHLTRLMSREDAARYGVVPDTGTHDMNNTCKTTRKRDADERKEQATFANWLLLQNSQGRKIPFSWHATHTRSKATPGTPDFYVGINGRSLWIEFKRDRSCRLTPEQNEFRVACEAQGIEWHLVCAIAVLISPNIQAKSCAPLPHTATLGASVSVTCA